MQRYLPFYDFKIEPEFFQNVDRKNCRKLIELGFRTIAVNYQIKECDQSNKKNSTSALTFPDHSKLPNKFEELVILKRLTIDFETLEFLQKVIQHPKINEYNLTAIICKNKVTLKRALLDCNVDIVSFNPFEKSTINEKSFFEVIRKKNTFLELMYVPAILSGLPRQNIISMAHRYHIFGKSRNIIISSSAQRAIQLRGPYDIASLALIFGLNKQQAKDAIAKNCRQVLIEAQSRRFGQMTIINNFQPVSVSPIELDEISDNEFDVIIAKDDGSCIEIVDESCIEIIDEDDEQMSKKAKLT